MSVEYEKPEVVRMANALEAIESVVDKGMGSFDPMPTDAAYRADEE